MSSVLPVYIVNDIVVSVKHTSTRSTQARSAATHQGVDEVGHRDHALREGVVRTDEHLLAAFLRHLSTAPATLRIPRPVLRKALVFNRAKASAAGFTPASPRRAAAAPAAAPGHQEINAAATATNCFRVQVLVQVQLHSCAALRSAPPAAVSVGWAGRVSL